MTQAYDLFSGKYIDIDERKEFRSEKDDAIAAFQMQLMVDDWRELWESFILYGSPVAGRYSSRGFFDLAEDRRPKAEITFDHLEYVAPNLGPAPAAKPDQPRHWVAMNQPGRSPRRKR